MRFQSRLRKFPWEGNGTLILYSCLGNPMAGGAWQSKWSQSQTHTPLSSNHRILKKSKQGGVSLLWYLPYWGDLEPSPQYLQGLPVCFRYESETNFSKTGEIFTTNRSSSSVKGFMKETPWAQRKWFQVESLKCKETMVSRDVGKFLGNSK